MHEARLHVDGEQHAKPDHERRHVEHRLASANRCGGEAKRFCQRNRLHRRAEDRLGSGLQERHDDERQLEEVEEERQQEYRCVDEDEEPIEPARQRGQQMLDPLVAVDAVERQRENPCADQDEQHERRQLGRPLQRLAHDGPVQPVGAIVRPALEAGQRQRSEGPHRSALGRRGEADEDRAQHEEDQQQRRHHDERHPLGQSRNQPPTGRMLQHAARQRDRERNADGQRHGQNDAIGPGER